MDLLATHLLIQEWIYQAGDKIRRGLGEALTIDEKSARNDLVTNVDKEVEQFFVSNIRATFPTHKIMGEEGFGDELTSMDGYVWLIDPIDGTLNFIKKQDDFGIMVAVYLDGVGLMGYIYDVMRDQLVYGIKGYGAYENGLRLTPPAIQSLADGVINVNGHTLMDASATLQQTIKQALATRTVGAASLEHMQVIKGQAVAYFSKLLAPWDVASSVVIAEELGLHYSTLDGKPINFLAPNKKTTAVICTKKVAEELLPAFKAE